MVVKGNKNKRVDEGVEQKKKRKKEDYRCSILI